MSFERPSSIREAAYKHLRQAILLGSLSPGKRISEPALAQTLGLSRTPIREALQSLAKEGLVEIIPHKGARVRQLSSKEIQEVYQVRAVLEGEAACLAACHATPAEVAAIFAGLEHLNTLDPNDLTAQRQADMKFHSCFVAAGHNSTLERLFNDLQGSLSLLRTYTSNLSQTLETQAQHLAIAEAIRDQKAEVAANAAKTHVLHFLELLLAKEILLDKEIGQQDDKEANLSSTPAVLLSSLGRS
ncbi:MAG: GntR family transcriptional regulator [Trueperaceae bacterium]